MKCPSREWLVQVLTHQLDGEEFAAVEGHVEECEQCQRRLEELTHGTLPQVGQPAAPSRPADLDPTFLLRLLGQAPPLSGAKATHFVPGEWPTAPGYEVLGELGRGGMGVVYKARQLQLKRLVALKMLLGGAGGPEELARFRREAEAVGRLQHPNIVQVHEVGEQGGRPWFSLELLEGGNLAQKLAATPQPAAKAAALVELLARAVHYAHQHGVVHRDLKPSNVLLTSDGAPKISDFGLAKYLTDESGQTGSGSVLGTPSYMAPEQAAGRTREVGPAADVYALGAILYECLTGRPPFKGESAVHTLFQVCAAEPVPPSRLQLRCPRELDTICLKCLEKQPMRRYGSALALADDLGRWQRGEPIRAQPGTALGQVVKWGRRHPAATSAVAVVLLSLLILTGASLWFAARLQRGRDFADTQRVRAERAERDALLKLFESYVAQAKAGRLSRHQGQRFDSLHAIGLAVRLARQLELPQEESARRLHELRNLAIACLVLPDVRIVKEWDGKDMAGSVDFDDALRHYAHADLVGNVRVRRVIDDVEVGRLAGNGSPVQPHFTPDGATLLLWGWQGKNRIDAWRPGEGRPFFVAQEEGEAVNFEISPDGRRFAVSRGDGAVTVYDLPSGRRALQLRGPEDSRPELAFAPDGERLAVVPGGYHHPCRRTVEIHDLASGRRVAVLKHADRVSTARWRPDGKTLAVGAMDANEIILWDVASGRQVRRIPAQKGGRLFLGVNATGEILSSTSLWTGGLRLWDFETGKELLRVMGTMLHFVRSTADGRLFAWERAEGKVRLWEAAPGRAYRSLADLPYTRPAVSPDGRLLAVGRADGVALWDLSNGRPLARVGIGNTTFVMFEPSGAMLTGGENEAGLLRWPCAAGPAGTASWRFGPPKRLLSLSESNSIPAASRDGRVLAVPQQKGGVMVVHPGPPARQIWLGPQRDVRSAAVSPDGRFVATASWWWGEGVKVWDAHTGKRLKDLAPGSHCHVTFGADGRWLAASVDRQVHLWEVGTWRPGPAVGKVELHAIALSPAAERPMLAVETGQGIIRLIDPDSGTEAAQLEDPHQGRASWLVFTSDGARLIAANPDNGAIQVWDLRAIRLGLADLGLDWEAPPYPPAPPPAAQPGTVEVNVGFLRDPQLELAMASAALVLQPMNPEAYYRRGRAHVRLGQWQDALVDLDACLSLLPGFANACALRAQTRLVLGAPDKALADYTRAVALRPDEADYRDRRWKLARQRGRYDLAIADLTKLVALSPDHPEVLNDLAWQLVIGPETLRDPERALPLIERALRLWPLEAGAHNTLGVVLYRLGRYGRAVGELEASLKGSKGRSAGYDLFFLAMCHHRLGQASRARKCFEQAVLWRKKPAARQAPNDAKELDAIEAEALQTLGKAFPAGEARRSLILAATP